MRCDYCNSDKVTSVGKNKLCHTHSREVDRYKKAFDVVQELWPMIRKLKIKRNA